MRNKSMKAAFAGCSFLKRFLRVYNKPSEMRLPIFRLRWLLVLIPIVAVNLTLRGQPSEGIIVDAHNYKPIPFAAITPAENPLRGVMSDVRGRVRIDPAEYKQSLKVSHVGYQPAVIPPDYFVDHDTLMMQPRTRKLDEVTVKAGENPAHPLIRKTIAARERHNPDKLEAYRCAVYTKTRVGGVPNRKNLDDSTYKAYKQKSDSVNFFLMETVAERYYQAPGKVKQRVKGMRTSGLENPGFSLLPTDFQPFHVYHDYLHIYEMDFLNPIAKGAVRKYFFQLKDTLFKERDSVFVIHFRPRRGKNFNGLEGNLYIHTDGYAVKNIQARSASEDLMQMRINQEYSQVAGGQWFPAAIDFELIYPEYPSKELGMHLKSYSHVRDVEFGVPPNAVHFSTVTQELSEGAQQRDSAFWQQQRAVPLERIDKETYRFVDSVFAANKVQKIYDIAMELSTHGHIPVSVIGVKPIWLYNGYEKNHLGIGVSTRDSLIPHLNLSGYGAYGTGDKQWKYGGALTFKALPYDRFTLKLSYAHTLREPGIYRIAYDASPPYLERYLTSRMQLVDRYRVDARWQVQYWKFGLSAQRTDLHKQRAVPDGAASLPSIAEAGVHVKFAPQEKQTPVFGTTVTIEQPLPVLYLNYTRGTDAFAGGEFVFNRLTARLSHDVLIRHLGTFSYHLEGGLISGDFPASWYFGMPGGKSKNFPVLIPETFQAMQRYNFFADRFVNVFLRHNFGTRLLKTEWLSPRISIAHNMSFGRISAKMPEAESYTAPEKGYFESGLILDNLLHINYLNFAYLGAGAGVFYRYGPYAAESPKSNFTVKATLNLTFSK